MIALLSRLVANIKLFSELPSSDKGLECFWDTKRICAVPWDSGVCTSLQHSCLKRLLAANYLWPLANEQRHNLCAPPRHTPIVCKLASEWPDLSPEANHPSELCCRRCKVERCHQLFQFLIRPECKERMIRTMSSWCVPVQAWICSRLSLFKIK